MGLVKNIEEPMDSKVKDKQSIVQELEDPIRLRFLSKKRIMRYFRHMGQRNEENLEKDNLFGKVPG